MVNIACSSVGYIFWNGVTVLGNIFQRKRSKLKFDTDLIEFHECSTPNVAMGSEWSVFPKQLSYFDTCTDLKEIVQKSTRLL